MRMVFIGAGELSCMTVQQLVENKHEVVIVEKDKARIDELSADLDVGFLHGDGSKPSILREADPAATDILFCLTGNDQYNIITSLVGRSLGYARVITRIEDPSFEHVCMELGLEDIIVPDYTIARYLADMCEGHSALELSAVIKDDARLFSFVTREEDAGPVTDLNLPVGSKLMFFYRNGKFSLPEADTELQPGDEAIVVSRHANLPALEARWIPKAQDTAG